MYRLREALVSMNHNRHIYCHQAKTDLVTFIQVLLFDFRDCCAWHFLGPATSVKLSLFAKKLVFEKCLE